MTLPHLTLPTKCTQQHTQTQSNQSQWSLSASRGLPHWVDVLHKATEQFSSPYTHQHIYISVLHVHILCDTPWLLKISFCFLAHSSIYYTNTFSYSVIYVVSGLKLPIKRCLLLDLCSSNRREALKRCRFFFCNIFEAG